MSKMAKLKKTEDKRIIEEEYNFEFSFKKFIGIIIIILLVLGAFYFVTTLVATDNTKQVVKNTKNSVINTDMATISNMLNKNDVDYYILAYKNESGKKTNLDIYNKYIKDIKDKNKDFIIYMVNLSDAINKTYISDTNNITNNLQEFKISDEALLHVINNKIEESFIGLSKINNKFNELKGE